MLRIQDATAETDTMIAHAVLRAVGGAAALLPYTREEAACTQLRKLMEAGGKSGTIEREGTNGFHYTCTDGDGYPFIDGSGETRALAICDAFLRCFPEPLE